MRITKRELRQIIKEELEAVLKEEQERLDEGSIGALAGIMAYLFAGGAQKVQIDDVEITKDQFETMVMMDAETTMLPDSMVDVHSGDVDAGLADKLTDIDGDGDLDVKSSDFRMGGKDLA